MAKTALPVQGDWVQSLVREPDPTRHNEKVSCAAAKTLFGSNRDASGRTEKSTHKMNSLIELENWFWGWVTPHLGFGSGFQSSCKRTINFGK